MHEMIKGANVALSSLSEDTGSVVVSLGWCSTSGDGDADVSVLLLDENGKVGGDQDFFFYNHPAAPDGSVQLLGKTPTGDGSEDRISLDLTAIPERVERVVIAASRYEGARFGDLDDLRLTIADRAGEPLLGFSIPDASVESAFLFGELYRRAGEWKFRAIGQGYETGLGGLATDFGIDIDDSPEDDPEEPEQPSDAPVDVTAAQTVTAATPEADATPLPAPRTEGPAAPAAALATTPAPTAPAAKPAVTRRPRTAKRKVTIPETMRKSLAENENWQQSRLFPASSVKSDREREMRATSVLLSVMAQVPEFGRRLTAAFGAPAGRMETFTEVTLPHGETPKRPDGVIRVERAGRMWTALVETKTNGNPLKPEQVQAYADIAARRGYEAVITLSNDVALDGRPVVEVKIDRRRKNKVALWHLSWTEVAHQAQMLIRHEGVANAAHAWLLQELLHYLRNENSGCHGFQNMGPAWVPVRKGIDDETLVTGDSRAVAVVESWERLIRQICLRLGGELGQKVLPVQRAKRGVDPDSRRAALADDLCAKGRLHAELRIDGTPGVLAVTADLRTAKLRTSMDLPADEQGYPLARAKRLVRQLAEAPADLHIETLLDGDTPGPRGTLERLRPEPGDLLPGSGARITGFRLSLFKSMGSGRGNAESGFIRSVDEAVDRFHQHVITHLDARPAGRRRRATEGADA
ncbi:TerD family protein [Streptomyces sp. MJP52]|uniref:TerD family protein n=1 Tax=Streptomyces sp. MJP52 TaxID=2940555 RepID=UPI002476FB61|nr:TerD family protein [Streptomyces sp. MJP52]MDH6227370.1 stress response protein SCP2 [Streptomyces sp. MJP52]